MSSLGLKKMVRDYLASDSAMQGFLGITTTASAYTVIKPTFTEGSGSYPQIIYSLIEGPTDAGLDSQNNLVTFTVEVQSTGGVNPHKTFGDILSRISGIFDDKALSGAAISGTGIYGYHCIREGGPDVTFDEQRKVYRKSIGYSFKVTGG